MAVVCYIVVHLGSSTRSSCFTLYWLLCFVISKIYHQIIRYALSHRAKPIYSLCNQTNKHWFELPNWCGDWQNTKWVGRKCIRTITSLRCSRYLLFFFSRSLFPLFVCQTISIMERKTENKYWVNRPTFCCWFLCLWHRAKWILIHSLIMPQYVQRRVFHTYIVHICNRTVKWTLNGAHS